jgi:DNA-binding SARP family transcriptional activator
MLEFRILGPLQILDGERDLTPGREKHRALVAALLLHPGEVVSADRLIDELWGESAPRTAKGALQNYVSLVRKALGGDVLVSRPPGYALQVAPGQVDLSRFEQLVTEARTAEPAERETTLREALALWRGPALAGFEYAPFAQVEAGRLEELRLVAEEELIETRLELGQSTELVPELERLIAAHPYRERLRGQLLLALYRSGRQADALEAYQQARRDLDELLGLEPSPALRDLEQAILRQDPDLAPPVPAEPAPPVEERRKTVTVLFADVVSSTALGESLDPEATRDVMSRYFAAMRAAIEYHGGTVEKFAGDEVMAVFGVPVAREDDALRAVRAAALMREGLTALNEVLDRERGVRIAMRTGVNTGEVMTGDVAAGYTFVTGDPVNVGKRLEQAAAAGEVLIGESTYRLVRHAVVAESAGDLAAFRLLALVEGAPALARRLETPLVDREEELAELRAAFARARDGRRCVVATAFGDPGIGKTRLVGELLAGLREQATVLLGHCVAYGDGATFMPLAEMVAGIGTDPATVLAGEDDRDLVAGRIAELLGRAEGSAGSGEGFWAVRRLFEGLARQRPLVALFEDVHWAEPTLLDLIEYLGGFATGEPILLLCLARPEFLEARPQWLLAAPDAVSLRLEPLEDEQAQVLLESLNGDVSHEVHERIAGIAEGNPLFVEQLLAYTREAGADALDAVPPSLEALLASRLDLLAQEERTILQCAAVVGREFWRGAVVDLAPAELVPRISSQLLALVRRGFVRPARSAFALDDAFRFDHPLIRLVAYTGIPKAQRAELHERHADWLAAQPVGTDELIGYHLEQAYRYGSELGPIGRRLQRLAADAGERLGAAGIRAWKRGDTPATVNLLQRATKLLPEQDPYRLELMCELGGALRTAGDLSRAENILAEAQEASVGALNRRLEMRARVELANIRVQRNPVANVDVLYSATNDAIPVLEALEDYRSLGQCWLLNGVGHSYRCRISAWAEATEQAIACLQRAGWPAHSSFGSLAAALFYGPVPAPDAITRCTELIGERQPSAEAYVLPWLGALWALVGNFEAARRSAAEGRRLHEGLGQRSRTAIDCGFVDGEIELLDGKPDAAEQVFRETFQALERMGDKSYLATYAARLAESLYRQDQAEEAARWAERAEELAPPEDVFTQCLWRGVQAKLLARRGRVEDGQEMAQYAVKLAADTDALSLRANLQLDLAEVLRQTDQPLEASRSLQEARRLFELKGNLVAANAVASPA